MAKKKVDQKERLARRDALLRIGEYRFGIAGFGQVREGTLRELLNEGFHLSTPSSLLRESFSPTGLFEFLEKYPEASAHGYVEDPNQNGKNWSPDVAVMGIRAPAKYHENCDFIRDWTFFSHTADQLSFDPLTGFYCEWD